MRTFLKIVTYICAQHIVYTFTCDHLTCLLPFSTLNSLNLQFKHETTSHYDIQDQKVNKQTLVLR